MGKAISVSTKELGSIISVYEASVKRRIWHTSKELRLEAHLASQETQKEYASKFGIEPTELYKLYIFEKEQPGRSSNGYNFRDERYIDLKENEDLRERVECIVNDIYNGRGKKWLLRE